MKVLENLSVNAVAAFERDGFLSPLVGISSARADAARRAVETIGGEAAPLRLCHLWFHWAYDLVLDPRILDYVEALLGPNFIVWGSMVFQKPPLHPAYISWHQDAAYPGRDRVPAVSAWVALTDSTTENGCMRVVPGSHGALRPHVDGSDPNNLLRAGRGIEGGIDPAGAVDVTLRAGQMSLHHRRIVHGSNPNRSNTARIGFVIRYATPAMPDPGFPVVLARGKVPPHSRLIFAEQPVETEESLALFQHANAALAAA